MVQPLPRLLWELGSSQPATSLTALRMLHNAGRYARSDGPISATLQDLQIQMTPLYLSAMPAKVSAGKAKTGTQKEERRLASGEQAHARLVPGPLARLPHDCQVTALSCPLCI